MIPLQLLPPDLFPPDVQPLIYFTILPTIIGLLLAFDFIFYFFVMPSEAKFHTWNKRKKKPIFDIHTEDGRRVLETGRVHSSGAVELHGSKENISLGLPLTRSQIKEKLPKDATPQQIAKKVKEIRENEKVIFKPSTTSYGARIFHVFRTTAIATSLAALVGLEYDGQSKTAPMNVRILAKVGKRVVPAKVFLKDGKELKHWIVDVLLPVDPTIVRKYFDPDFNPTTAKRFYWLGYERGAGKGESFLKKYLPYIILAIIIVVGALIALMFLGGGGVA